MDDQITTRSRRQKVGDVAGDLLSKYGTLLILLVMVVTMSLLSPYFLTVNNLLNVLRQISIIAITALVIKKAKLDIYVTINIIS